MDTIPYEAIVSSAAFKFVVGPDKREFFIHSALVASLSSSLKVLVDGPMQEAADQCVEWAETDEMTFVLFSQFAYTGNYDGSMPEVEPVTEHDTFDGLVVPSKYIKRGSKSYVYPGARRTVVPFQFKDQCPDALCHHDTASPPDASGVLLVHARMYTFADYHGIDKLKKLALRNLHRILVHFTLSDESIGSIIALVRCTYEHTRADPNDGLRSMVSMYGACHLLEFRGNKDFDALLREVGDFAGDLVQKICNQ